MQQGIQLPSWSRQLAVVAGYCALYALLHAMSLLYWLPQAGLRLSFVLLLPRRYWPALLLADMLSLAPTAYACIPQFGWTGALLHIFPVVAFAMLPVQWLRGYLSSQVPGKQAAVSMIAPNMLLLLICAAVYAVFAATNSTFQFILTFQPGEDGVALVKTWAPRYLLGSYLGCLIVVPLVMAVHTAIQRAGAWKSLVRSMGRNRLLLEGAVLGVSALGLLTALSGSATADASRQIVRIVMFVPVAWMTARYGWRGAAVGGTAASAGIMLTLPSAYDSDAIIAQTFVAFALTILLPVGARMDVLNAHRRQAQHALARRQRAARRELVQTESRIRSTTQDLERIYDALQVHYSDLIQRMGAWLPEGVEKRYRRHLITSKQQMFEVTNRIHPLQWQQHGLAVALRDGSIARGLEDAGFAYTARVPETVKALSPGVQLTLYRLACEAVAYQVAKATPRQRIHLDVRVHRAAAGAWMALTVTLAPRVNDNVVLFPTRAAQPKELLFARLGAQNLRPADMRDMVEVYGGKLQVSPKRQRIQLTLWDRREGSTVETTDMHEHFAH